MGRKAGTVLSFVGMVLLVMALIIVGMVSSAIVNPPSGLGGLAVIGLVGIGLVYAGAIWFVACILYLLAYLTTRGMKTRTTGMFFEVGGVLHFLFLINSVWLITKELSGSLIENPGIAVIFLVLPVVVGALLILGGLRRM